MKAYLSNDMKLLAFGDNHGDLLSLAIVQEKAKEADIVICVGDITLFGQDMNFLLEILNEFPKKVLLLHGNHEDEDELREATKNFPNVEFTHKDIHHIEDFDIITYGGDGFSRRDPEFEEHVNNVSSVVRNFKKCILVLHGPPINTKLDIPFEDFHSGSKSYRDFIEKHQPLLSLSGHIHEGEKELDYINETVLYNPGPDGELFDLDELHDFRSKKKKFTKENISNKY